MEAQFRRYERYCHGRIRKASRSRPVETAGREASTASGRQAEPEEPGASPLVKALRRAIVVAMACSARNPGTMHVQCDPVRAETPRHMHALSARPARA